MKPLPSPQEEVMAAHLCPHCSDFQSLALHISGEGGLELKGDG